MIKTIKSLKKSKEKKRKIIGESNVTKIKLEEMYPLDNAVSKKGNVILGKFHSH